MTSVIHLEPPSFKNLLKYQRQRATALVLAHVLQDFAEVKRNLFDHI